MKLWEKELPAVGLKTQILLSTIALFGAVGLVFCCYTIKQSHEILAVELQKRGISIAQTLAYNSKYGVLTRDKIVLNDLIYGLTLESDVAAIIIYDAEEKILAETYKQRLDESKALRGELKPIKETLISYPDKYKGAFFSIFAPVKAKATSGGSKNGDTFENMLTLMAETYPDANNSVFNEVIKGYVQVIMSLEKLKEEKRKILLVSIFITLSITIIGIICSVAFADFLMKPIKSMAGTALLIAQGELSLRVRKKANDEIGQFVDSFNHMVNSLQKRENQIRELNENLDLKVKNRTTALEEANQGLKETQAQLVQAGKMAAIGVLAAGVSHELNNPLAGILGYSQYIMEKIRQKGVANTTTEDIAQYVTYLEKMEKATQRCKTIIANLLKFAHAAKTETIPLGINQVMEDTLIFTQHQLVINKVKLIKQIGKRLPLVQGNEHHLQQVFTNIIINAQQAMPEGGKLTITTCQNGMGEVQISFADTGNGIPRDKLAKIFDPFFTTKPPGQGTGLGLSLSYGIIQEHKGKILVDSPPGAGTTFHIILPAIGSDPAEQRCPEGVCNTPLHKSNLGST